MKHLKKIMIGIWSVALLVPLAVFAAPVSVNRLNNDHIEPLKNTDYIKSQYFTATSTIATSTFPNIYISQILRLGLNRNSDNVPLYLKNWTQSNGDSDEAFSIGFNNSLSTFPRQIVVGNDNTINTDVGGAFGYANSVRDEDAWAFGHNNTMRGSRVIGVGVNNILSGLGSNEGLFGHDNALNGDGNQYGFGRNIAINASDATVFGQNITNAVSGSTMVGNGNTAKITIDGSGNTTATGYIEGEAGILNESTYQDYLGSTGGVGNVLISTGSATQWVATSSLGISGGVASFNTNPFSATYFVATSTTATSSLSNIYTSNLIATTSAGINAISLSGLNIANFGVGSSQNSLFYGGVIINDTLNVTNKTTLSSASTTNLTAENRLTATNVVATGTIDLAISTSTTKGVITQNGSRLLHTYGTTNLFIGPGAGNFTLDTTIARSNVGIGPNALSSLAAPTLSGNRGAFNVAVGNNALLSCTTCSANFGLGDSTFASNGFGGVTTQDSNVGIGSTAGYGTTASQSIFIGNLAGRAVGSPYTATDNIAIGYSSNFGGLGGLSNAISIGSNTNWTRSNQVQIGNSSVVETMLRGNVSISTSTPILPTARLDIVGVNGASTDLLGISTTTSAAGATTRLLTVTKAGNVGIGTSTPTDILAVVGNIFNSGRLTTSNIVSTSTATSTFAGTVKVTAGSIINSEYTVATSSTMTIDWNQSNQQLVKLGSSAVTINMTNYVAGQTLRLPICQNSIGGATVTWDSAIRWASSTAPTLSAANHCDLMTFTATNGTSTLFIMGGYINF